MKLQKREVTIEDKIIERFSMIRLLGYLKEMTDAMGIEPGDSTEEIREKAERFMRTKREEKMTPAGSSSR